MSTYYSINIYLNTQFNKESIEKILLSSIRNKLALFKYVWGELNVELFPQDINESIQSIITGDENNLHCINMKIANTVFTLHFIDHEGCLNLMATTFYYPWLKEFTDGQDIDIGRYTKIMIDLVEDFKIIEIKIEKN